MSLERGVEGMSVPSKTYSYLAAGRPLLAIMSSTTDISMKIIDNAAGFFHLSKVKWINWPRQSGIYPIILIFVMKWGQMLSKFSKRIMKGK
ncbi:hypothetical protein ACFSQ7_11165 [Paenibacillus rhizoplanae]